MSHDSESVTSAALPRDENGHTYVTDLMLSEDRGLYDLVKRTQGSWQRDHSACRFVLYPTVGRS